MPTRENHGDGRGGPYGLPTAAALVVSSMVGTGVLTTSGYLILDLGSGPLTLALWALGGLVALCGALTLAEIASTWPMSGGEYAILHRAFGTRLAFLGGWVALWLGFAAPIAAASHAWATYLFITMDLATELPSLRLAASAAIAVVAILHSSGSHLTSRFQGVIAVATLALLLAAVVFGLLAEVATPHPPARQASTLTPSASPLVWLSSFVLVSYSYTGWNAAAYLGSEIKDPRRCLPRAILLGAAAVTLIYLGLNLVYVRAISSEQLRELVDQSGGRREAVEPIAELAARALFGPRWARALSALVSLILLGSLSALMVTGPRVAAAMAEAGELPAIAARRSRRGEVPIAATWLLASVALALLWSGSFESIVVFSGVGLGLFSLPTVAAVFIARRSSNAESTRVFRSPAHPLAPAVFLLTTAGLLIAAFLDRPGPSWLAVLAILSGLPFHEWTRRSGPHSRIDINNPSSSIEDR